MSRKSLIFLIGWISFIPFLHLSAQGYKIVNRFPVEGDGGWDYLSVDEATGRIFVSHGNVVNV
ncbi:MAG TPA: hypothetical protein VK155_13840, partial [Bacteroidales bacterium]|nr:hypothetical protein [Bacteroidales bacterium]